MNLCAFGAAVAFGLTIAVAQGVGGSAGVTADAGEQAADSSQVQTLASAPRELPEVIVEPVQAVESIDELPVPTFDVSAAVNIACEISDPLDGDDFVRAAGGGTEMRDSFVAGEMPCLSLDDPETNWVVVNKQRAFDPIDWAPDEVVTPQGMPIMNDAKIRPEAAAALEDLNAAVQDAGKGGLGAVSGFRSYESQGPLHAEQAAADPVDAERTSAKAGHSEHQTGLTMDVVACDADGTCSGMDDFGDSAQGKWVAENGWRYGWIVRYESGTEDVSGYAPEPWHLRYIGVEAAIAYHEGGFHTLEDFFDLPAAPSY